MWKEFDKLCNSNDDFSTNGKSVVTNFKDYMKKELEKILTARYTEIKIKDKLAKGTLDIMKK
jgi:hypothetical protein